MICWLVYLHNPPPYQSSSCRYAGLHLKQNSEAYLARAIGIPDSSIIKGVAKINYRRDLHQNK